MSLEAKNASPLLSAFSKLGNLIHQQKAAHAKYNVQEVYGQVDQLHLEEGCVKLFIDAYKDMGVGEDEDSSNIWQLPMVIKQKGTLDSELLYQSLRKLSDEDIKKIRYFNRFVGQQLYGTTYEDFYELQESRVGVFVNPFFTRFIQQSNDFANFFGKTLPTAEWPKVILRGKERDDFAKIVNQWQIEFRTLPGIDRANLFFSEQPKDIFNTFFHLQRQFDSPSYRDIAEDGTPYPQPLPRIAAYRDAISELQNEFTELEGSVSMCFDYCRMSVDKVVGFVLSAEDAFLRITSRLDHDYPIDIDHCHKMLHDRAHDVKMMMFPLRCLFFDELDARRKTTDPVDNTLDSYVDMTLGETEVHVPPSYEHSFSTEKLLPELQQKLDDLNPTPIPPHWSTVDIIKLIQQIPHGDLNTYAEGFDQLSNTYEQQFKSDENDLNRRIARVTWLYLKAMSKKDLMAKASQERLDQIENMASKYANHAARFAEADVGPETDLRSLKDEQLPLMASPQQMEDLFRTAHVVKKLSENCSDFEDKAKLIAAGLQAAMDMMQKAGELMERMVKKMFPKNEDSADLLAAIRHLIELGYETQQALADLAKQEAIASRDKKAEAKCHELKQEVEHCKSKTLKIQGHLRDVLASKREIVEKMRITKGEKDYYHGQLRMITVMTIQSIQSQSS